MSSTNDKTHPLKPYLPPEKLISCVQLPLPKKVVHRTIGSTAVVYIDLRKFRGLPVEIIADQSMHLLQVESGTPGTAPTVAATQADADDFDTMSAGIMAGAYPAGQPVFGVVHNDLGWLAVALGSAGSIRIAAR